MQGREDTPLEQVLVSLSRDLFEHRTQQKITRVTVRELCPRFEFQIAATSFDREIPHGVPSTAIGSFQKTRRLSEIWNAGSVTEQMMDGYAAAGILAIVRQVIRKMSIQPYLSFAHKLKDEKGGELLCYRSQFELCTGIVWDMPFQVGESKTMHV